VYRWYGLDNVPADWGGSVAIIGVFDGVHRGHQRIIGRAVELARARNLPVVVITFDPHPGGGWPSCWLAWAPMPCSCSRSPRSSPG